MEKCLFTLQLIKTRIILLLVCVIHNNFLALSIKHFITLPKHMKSSTHTNINDYPQLQRHRSIKHIKFPALLARHISILDHIDSWLKGGERRMEGRSWAWTFRVPFCFRFTIWQSSCFAEGCEISICSKPCSLLILPIRALVSVHYNHNQISVYVCNSPDIHTHGCVHCECEQGSGQSRLLWDHARSVWNSPTGADKIDTEDWCIPR